MYQSLLNVIIFGGVIKLLNEKNKVENGMIVFTGDYMEMYIPDYYLDKRLAEELGGRMRVFGLFNLQIFDKNEKPIGKLETFVIPSMIVLESDDVEVRKMTLTKGVEEEKYHVLKFYNGDPIINVEYPQDSTNVELFLELLTGGKIPRTIPYNQIIQIWQENLRLNSVHLNVASNVLEAIISQIYRDPSKPEDNFAKVAGKSSNPNEYGYRPANIREVCARNSTFSALTFEDFDQMMTSSLNINKYNKKETKSPLEKIIKM